MNSPQKNPGKTQSVPSSHAAAHTSGNGISLPAVPILQPQAENQQTSVVQRYEADVLTTQKALVLAATDSGANFLKTNKTAQDALAASDDESKKLTPHFTSMGFEVEFSQQPQPNKHVEPKNDLNKAHVIVGTSPGYALFGDIPFVMETDAQLALEFVTPPLLAPLSDADGVVPDPAWEKAARKALEFSLRDISSAGEQSLSAIITTINSQFELSLPIPDKYKDIRYGDINKLGPGSHTNAQLNFMTTLEHYMAVNRGAADGGDAITEQIYLMAKEGLEGADNAHIYAVCQKIREIPSMMIDQTFSILLHHDEHPADEISKKKENKKLIDASKEQKDYRSTLASEASHIKDTATLWLKASFNQIVNSIPDTSYRTSIDVIEELCARTDELVEILKTTSQFDALKPFYEEDKIIAFIDAQLQPLQNLGYSKQKTAPDIHKKPAEQKTVSDDRKSIIGARPDTYIASDDEIADESLFLVETRKTTSYLGLTADDKYKKKK
jgi:hypothetical protein